MRPAKRAFTPVVDHVPLTVTIVPRSTASAWLDRSLPASAGPGAECQRTQNDPFGARSAATAPTAGTAPNGGYRVQRIRRAVTVGNERECLGQASQLFGEFGSTSPVSGSAGLRRCGCVPSAGRSCRTEERRVGK